MHLKVYIIRARLLTVGKNAMTTSRYFLPAEIVAKFEST